MRKKWLRAVWKKWAVFSAVQVVQVTEQWMLRIEGHEFESMLR